LHACMQVMNVLHEPWQDVIRATNKAATSECIQETLLAATW
jgi:hypothetical protein